jgi:hypothetical protein
MERKNSSESLASVVTTSTTKTEKVIISSLITNPHRSLKTKPQTCCIMNSSNSMLVK